MKITIQEEIGNLVLDNNEGKVKKEKDFEETVKKYSVFNQF
jgi:hypothetical protein